MNPGYPTRTTFSNSFATSRRIEHTSLGSMPGAITIRFSSRDWPSLSKARKVYVPAI
jgi:hypothetical protein